MAWASKFGQMVQDMTASGKTEWLMGKDDWCIQTVMCILEGGRTTKLMGKEFNKIIMEADTQAIGLKMNNTGMDLKNGQMAQHILVSTLTA